MNSRKQHLAPLLFIVIFAVLGAYALVRYSHAATLDGDVNGDSSVNITDLSILLTNFGKAGVSAQGDLNANGKVDIADLSMVLSNFGKTLAAVSNPVTPLVTGPVNSAPKLKWAPPVMGGPNSVKGGNYSVQTINVALSDTTCGGKAYPAQTDTCLDLDANTDYTVVLPKTAKYGGISIRGGHNIVIKGGHLINGNDDFIRALIRGIYIWDNATSKGRDRTVHIEGLFYEGSISGKDPVIKSDGIAINAPDTTVQVENTRMIGLIGRGTQYATPESDISKINSTTKIYASDGNGRTNGVFSTNKTTYDDGIANKTLFFWKNEHSDMIQPFGGVKALLVDRFSGSTNCQGFFLRPGTASGNKMGEFNFSNTNLTMDNPSNCAELLWFTNTDSYKDTAGKTIYYDVCGAGSPITLSNVWLSGGTTGRTLDQLVYPKSNTATTLAKCPAKLSNNNTSVTWPGLGVAGFAQYGKPSTGDFAPLGVPGLNYVSPGYQ